MDGDAKLSAFIDRLRSLKDLAARAAVHAAPLVEAAIRETAGSGLDPDGQPWTPTKGGTRPLANVARAIRVIPKGSAVIVGLAGHYVFHHFSKSKSLPQRRVIPGAGAIPANVVRALREGARKAFRSTMGGFFS